MDNLDALKRHLKDVEVIATDVDDTITIKGLLTSGVIRSIEYINSIGKKVVLVTGRSGGACTTLSQYLPVEMVIAENGGVIIKDHDIKTIDLPRDHKTKLHKCFKDIKRLFPGIREAQDNPFRLTDLSMDNLSVPTEALHDIRSVAESYGLTITVSSVQTHILSQGCNKAFTLKSFIKDKKIVTIGDSINDESMFNPELFPLSIGVANIRHYIDRLKYKPRWIMSKEQGEGFIEFVDVLKSITHIKT